MILTASRNMEILNSYNEKSEIAGIHQGDSMEMLERGDEDHDCK